MKAATEFWLGVCTVIGVAMAAGCCMESMDTLRTPLQTSQRPQFAASGTLVPDQLTHSLVHQVQSNQISFLRFDGTDFEDDKPVIVRNKQLIQKFVAALHHAQCDPLFPRPEMDTLEIHFKQQDEHRQRPVIFAFQPHAPKYCFGADFWKTLAALSLYQSAKRQEQVRLIAPHVHSIKLEVITSDSLLILKPKDVQHILQELAKSGAKFMDYSQEKPRLHLTLFASNGSKLSTEYLINEPLSAGDAPPNSLIHYYSVLKPELDLKTGQVRPKSHLL